MARIPRQLITTTKKPPSIVGLDIEAASIAATEVRANGSHAVSRAAIAPLDPGVVNEGEVLDAGALSASLKRLFSEHRLAKAVRIGIANQRVVVRSMQLPLIEGEGEIDTAVRFRAQEQIPMPLDQAVLDHRVVSRGTGPDGERQMEVLAVAARRDMIISLLEAVRQAGLRPIGIDLSAFGMIRALDRGPAPVPDDELEDHVESTVLYCYLGDATNLAVARGGQCLFTRLAPFGMESIAQRVAERDDVTPEDARDALLDVGLEESIDDFEGDESAGVVREALEEGASKLIDELRLSLDFYRAQEGAAAIEHVVLCGPGGSVPGLPERIQVGLGLGVEVMTPGALRGLDDEDAARLTVSYGLAIED
jgi:type IV pilus assembly protein PilM